MLIIYDKCYLDLRILVKKVIAFGTRTGFFCQFLWIWTIFKTLKNALNKNFKWKGNNSTQILLSLNIRKYLERKHEAKTNDILHLSLSKCSCSSIALSTFFGKTFIMDQIMKNYEWINKLQIWWRKIQP